MRYNRWDEPCELYPFAQPCKITRNGVDIFGRYIGTSNMLPSEDDIPFEDDILLIGTPGNSIIHEKRSNVYFNISLEDMDVLKDYEDIAREHNEWYHANRPSSELSEIGEFIHPYAIKAISRKNPFNY